MGIEKGDRTTIFQCDICPARYVERNGATWEDSRLASVRAKEAGWRLKKRRGGVWEAFCPDCHSTTDDYELP